MDKGVYVVISKEGLFLGFLIEETGVLRMYSFKPYVASGLKEQAPTEWQSYALQEVKKEYSGYKLIRCVASNYVKYEVEEIFI